MPSPSLPQQGQNRNIKKSWRNKTKIKTKRREQLKGGSLPQA